MSKRKIIFWGGTGQAKVLRELTRDDFDLQAVFDNSADVEPPFADIPLLRKWEGFVAWHAAARTEDPLYCLVAIGGDRGRIRVELQHKLSEAGLIAPVVIHRTAFVSADAQLGEGTQILANAAVCVEAKLGRSCIVNTSASVDHECRLGDGVHIGPGAHLAGTVEVGDFSFIGTGASVLPRVKIGRDCVIGAGTVVTRDLPDGVIAYGAPARVARQRS
jgi:sugar O-acyltransferase (sialic acid O-acetyltransferase NeuD family)